MSDRADRADELTDELTDELKKPSSSSSYLVLSEQSKLIDTHTQTLLQKKQVSCRLFVIKIPRRKKNPAHLLCAVRIILLNAVTILWMVLSFARR